ncbi:hypothetical protein MJO28_006847 [Puccinia striiformis f. sp. tritici]|uniref:Uncharacterized protein n=1 Tax=Puccinia striiformis f. sp. tritici TaxID=168172 RepID=A0ACC0EJ20_9BASI|nr:hypothetical protein MJO28_006847 [Puccinia striiformis f. sp. tritici]
MTRLWKSRARVLEHTGVEGVNQCGVDELPANQSDPPLAPQSKHTTKTAADKVQPSLFTSEEISDAAKEGGAKVQKVKGKAVSAIDLCLRITPRDNEDVYTQGLGFCAPGGSKTGTEFGLAAFELVKYYLLWVDKTQDLIQHKQIVMASQLNAKLMAAQAHKSFQHLLKSAPGLVQVSHPDPFWNRDTVNFDKIAEASKETTKGTTPELAGSWIVVLGMFARDDNDATPDYSTHNNRTAQIQGAWDRVNQLIKDSVAAVSEDIGPGRQRDGELDELDAVRNAEQFLHQRIQGLGGSNTKDSSKDTTEGLGFLTKRIFQMFLGLALVYEASTLDTKEIEYSETPGVTRKQLADKKKELYTTAIVKHGPGGLSPHEWSVARREAYGALSVFVAFGAAGWFSCFSNNRKYSHCDCYRLLTIGYERMKALRSLSTEDIHTNHPVSCGSWKYLNGYILTILSKAKLTNKPSNIDWFGITEKVSQSLERRQLGDVVLSDVYAELAQPRCSITNSGNAAPHPTLDSETKDSKSSLITLLKASVPQLISGSQSQAQSSSNNQSEREETPADQLSPEALRQRAAKEKKS